MLFGLRISFMYQKSFAFHVQQKLLFSNHLGVWDKNNPHTLF